MEPLSRSELRSLRGLTGRSIRERRGVFLIEGGRALRTALEAGAGVRLIAFDTGAVAQPGMTDLLELAEKRGIAVRTTGREVVRELSDTTTPSGVIASVERDMISDPDPGAIGEAVAGLASGGLLCLDGVADPGNVGSLLRTADAFGLHGVLLGRGSVEVTNPKVVRSAVGSLFSLPLIAGGVVLGPVLELLRDRGWEIYRAEAGQGRSLRSLEPAARWVLLLGSEAHGVSEEFGRVGEAVHIGLTGGAESLNVAVAGGIVLYELTRDRREPI